MLYFSVTVKGGIPRYDLLYASTFTRQMPGLVGNCEIANKLRKARLCKPKRDLPVQAFSSSLTLRQALHNLQVYNAECNGNNQASSTRKLIFCILTLGYHSAREVKVISHQMPT